MKRESFFVGGVVLVLLALSQLPGAGVGLSLGLLGTLLVLVLIWSVDKHVKRQTDDALQPCPVVVKQRRKSK